jgi:hypothetical protein
MFFRVRFTLQLAVYRQSLRLGDQPLEKHDQTKKKNSVVLVRKRTIPTERPTLVGEVTTSNFIFQLNNCG